MADSPPMPLLVKQRQKTMTDGRAQFEERYTIENHQLGEGSTLLAAATQEHNILACSNMYDDAGCRVGDLVVSFEQLGSLLSLPARDAEKLAVRMIAQERLFGKIDQVNKKLHFRTAQRDCRE